MLVAVLVVLVPVLVVVSLVTAAGCGLRCGARLVGPVTAHLREMTELAKLCWSCCFCCRCRSQSHVSRCRRDGTAALGRLDELRPCRVM